MSIITDLCYLETHVSKLSYTSISVPEEKLACMIYNPARHVESGALSNQWQYTSVMQLKCCHTIQWQQSCWTEWLSNCQTHHFLDSWTGAWWWSRTRRHQLSVTVHTAIDLANISWRRMRMNVVPTETASSLRTRIIPDSTYPTGSLTWDRNRCSCR